MKPIPAVVACGLLALSLALAAPATAAYPDGRRITIVVPFGPGSGGDIGARLVGQKLGEALGTAVVIENRPGANGSIAAEYAANAKPDGHTLFVGSNSSHGANPALQRELRYDPLGSFAPINRIVVFTSVIVVNPAMPVTTMRELIDFGRSNEVMLATGNASGVVQSETLARQVGWQRLVRVPFKSNPQAMVEVMAARVQVMFTDIASAASQLKAGAVRPLAVTSKARSAVMPELPTIAESGVPDYDLSGWIGLFAPAGTPPAIVDQLNRELARVLNTPEVRRRFLDLGAEPGPMTVSAYTEWVRGEVEKWTRLVRQAGIEPE
ncbi:MAG: Bug family tripartite tricarboxylate transporter substrate binding protein [Lautropia sp.]